MEKKKKEKGKNELKINSNIITICLVVLVVLVLGILIFKNKGNTSNLEKQKQLVLSENRMVTVNKNGQYGFVNTKGKELTKLDYDYVLDYDGKYPIVSKNDKLVSIKTKSISLPIDSITAEVMFPLYKAHLFINSGNFSSTIKPVFFLGIL